MQIGSLIIHRSATIRKRLENHGKEFNSRVFARTMQIYLCRVFGFCIYRDEKSYQKLANKILNDDRVQGDARISEANSC